MIENANEASCETLLRQIAKVTLENEAGGEAMVFFDLVTNNDRASVMKTRDYNPLSLTVDFDLSWTSSGGTRPQRDCDFYAVLRAWRSRDCRPVRGFDFVDVRYPRNRDVGPCWLENGELNPQLQKLDVSTPRMVVQHGHGCDRESGAGGGKQALGGLKGDGGIWRLRRGRGGTRGARGEMLVYGSSKASLLDRFDPVLYDHHVLRRLSLQPVEGDVKALADASCWDSSRDEFLVFAR